MFKGVVKREGDNQPHQPKQNPTGVLRECPPDEKRVAKIDSVRIDSKAIGDKFQRPECDLFEKRDA
jgi:hypothetical protein